MVAIGIGIFLIVQAIVLVFAFTLCKSAAMADREYERARIADSRTRSNVAGRAVSHTESRLSPETKPASRLGYTR